MGYITLTMVKNKQIQYHRLCFITFTLHYSNLLKCLALMMNYIFGKITLLMKYIHLYLDILSLHFLKGIQDKNTNSVA